MLSTENGSVPLLYSVTNRGPLVVPTTWLPNASFVALVEAAGVTVSDPDLMHRSYDNNKWNVNDFLLEN